MTTGEKKNWDQRYEKTGGPQGPADWLRQIFDSGRWPMTTGLALDIAAGTGGNALFLAERGFQVDAMDISEVGLEKGRTEAQKRGLTINFIQTDLDSVELPRVAYDLIINFNFLLRPLIPKMKAALKAGGHIIFETYLIDQQELGHPKNPAYLLDHNELLQLFRGIRVLFFREGKFSEGGKEAYRAGLLGQNERWE